jgi:hypothetical protein
MRGTRRLANPERFKNESLLIARECISVIGGVDEKLLIAVSTLPLLCLLKPLEELLALFNCPSLLEISHRKG